MKTLLWVFRVLIWPIRGVTLRLLLRSSPGTTHRGIEITTLSGEDLRQQFEEKVKAALDLIASTSQVRLERVRNSMPRIVLVAAGGGYFEGSACAYMVDGRTLPGRSAASLALGVLHEALHARLHALGIPYSRPLRARIEGLCAQEELRFAGRVAPNDVALRQEVLDKTKVPWWTDDDHARRAAAAFREHGLPEWLARATDRSSRND